MHFKYNLLTQIMKYIIPPHNLVEIRIPKKFSVCIFLEDTDDRKNGYCANNKMQYKIKNSISKKFGYYNLLRNFECFPDQKLCAWRWAPNFYCGLLTLFIPVAQLAPSKKSKAYCLPHA
jgi:hypothetical protein